MWSNYFGAETEMIKWPEEKIKFRTPTKVLDFAWDPSFSWSFVSRSALWHQIMLQGIKLRTIFGEIPVPNEINGNTSTVGAVQMPQVQDRVLQPGDWCWCPSTSSACHGGRHMGKSSDCPMGSWLPSGPSCYHLGKTRLMAGQGGRWFSSVKTHLSH